MDDQQRVRELLAEEYRKEGLYGQVDHTYGAAARAAIAAITAALRAAPDGFVMVPMDITQPMRDAGNKAIRMCDTEPGMGIADRAFYAWQAMLAASPQGVND